MDALETPSPRLKPLWQQLLPWLAGLMVLLCLLAICEPFVANYQAIKGIEDKGGIVELKLPFWIPDFVGGWLSREQTYFIYDVVYIDPREMTWGDAQTKRLARLAHLKTLYLSNTQVSNDGLKHLSQLTKLRNLILSNTQVSDSGLKHLIGLTNLKILSLHHTQVSDAGLKHLTGLTNLKYLMLFDTKVTQKGAENLQRTLPKCLILRSSSCPPHIPFWIQVEEE